jgi:alkylation response protein AidB-like acyl-CoA dehydrogenase
MYGFEPTDEQRMLVEAAQRFAEKELRPAAHEADEAGQLPPALIEKGWELGLLQASIPESYGGFGERSAVTGALAAEALGWGDLSAALAVLAPGAFALSILAGGTEEQKQKLLPPIIEAEWRPFVPAFVEPDFDFYAGEMRTRAARQNGGYTLQGVKALVPFAEQAQSFLVFAALDGQAQAFVVPAGTPGLTVAEREKLLGIQAVPTYRVQLQELKLPAQARLGGEQGSPFEAILASSQVAIGALAVGLARGAFEYARDYAKERVAFGSPIAQKQSIAFTLADMAIEIEAIRLLVWEAAWMLDAGREEAARSAYLALTGAADMAMMVTDRAVQILGGHGYIREHPVERWMRNARGVASYVGLAMV